jgi:folate-dependent phosphoribosylglycinamide formyltransferase PurN
MCHPSVTAEAAHPTAVVITNGNHFARIILEPVLADGRWRVRGIVHIRGDHTGKIGLRSAITVGRRATLPYVVYKVTSAAAFVVTHALRPTLARDVESIARDVGIDTVRARHVGEPQVAEFVRGCAPDFLISVSCPQRIPPEILGLARRASLNVHSSPLPAYAGLAPYFWVLANGETETATTVHYMVPRLDAGRILVQARCPIPSGVSAFSLFEALARLGGKALQDGLALALEGSPGWEQRTTRRSYFSHPDFRSYLRLRRHGHRLCRIGELVRSLRG